MAKLKFRAIPSPSTDVQSLHRTVEALREVVEMLTRQRGDETVWPPTISELRRIGVIGASIVMPDSPEGKKS